MVAESAGGFEHVGRKNDAPVLLLSRTYYVLEHLNPFRIDSGRRFIEKQEIRIVDHASSQRYFPLHSVRIRSNEIIGSIEETKTIQQFLDSSSQFDALYSDKTTHESNVLSRR